MNVIRMRVNRWVSRRAVTGLLTLLGGVAAQAATNYWDTSTASGLQSGNGTWGTDSYWSPDTNGTTLQAWTSGDIACFQTGGSNTVSVSGSITNSWLMQTNSSTVTTVNGPGTLVITNATGIVNGGNQVLAINAPITFKAAQMGVNAAGADIMIAGNIAIFNGLNKKGGFNLTLTGTNTASGAASVVIENGTVTMTTMRALPTGPTLQVGNGNGNGIFVYNSADSTSATVGNQVQIGNNGSGTGGGTIKNNSSDSGAFLIFSNATFSAFSGTQSGSRTLTLGGSNTGNNEIKGVIQDNIAGTPIGIIKADAGKWILSATNLYSGTTVLSNGTLAVSGSGALSTNLVTLAGGWLAGASGGGTLSNAINMVSNATYDTSSGDLALVGAITNGGALTKAGSGTLTLSGTNTYTGATTVSNGTLLVNGATTNTLITVVSGATLGGTGKAGNVSIASNAVVCTSVGAAVGTLSVTNLVLAEGAKLNWKYNTGSGDLISSSGAITLPATATVTVTGSGAEPATWKVLTGSLAGATDLKGWTVTGSGAKHNMRAVRSGNDVILMTPTGFVLSFH